MELEDEMAQDDINMKQMDVFEETAEVVDRLVKKDPRLTIIKLMSDLKIVIICKL